MTSIRIQSSPKSYLHNMLEDSVVYKMFMTLLNFLTFYISPLISVLYVNKNDSFSKEDKQSDPKNISTHAKDEDKHSLFPSTIKNDSLQNENSNLKSCSTNLNTRLVPVKNERGEIEWNFTDDPKSFKKDLSPFLMNNQSINVNPTPNNMSLPNPEVFDLPNLNQSFNQSYNQSFTTNQSVTSNEQYQEEDDEDQDLYEDGDEDGEIDDISSIEEKTVKVNENGQMISPITSNSSINSSPNDFKPTLPSNGAKVSNSPDSISSKNNDGTSSEKIHVCPYCPAEFRIRGYLTRHMKKHAVTKAYSCPFFNMNSSHKCHPNGGFSRRDTYKTHLKSRHFKYPPGTKSHDRASIGGKCGICAKYFQSNENWVESHIESGECEGLPNGFVGKSRLNLKKKKLLAAKLKNKKNEIENSVDAKIQQQFTPSTSPNNLSPIYKNNIKDADFASLEYSINSLANANNLNSKNTYSNTSAGNLGLNYLNPNLSSISNYSNAGYPNSSSLPYQPPKQQMENQVQVDQIQSHIQNQTDIHYQFQNGQNLQNISNYQFPNYSSNSNTTTNDIQFQTFNQQQNMYNQFPKDFEDEYTLDTETIQVKYPNNFYENVGNNTNKLSYDSKKNYNNYFTESFK